MTPLATSRIDDDRVVLLKSFFSNTLPAAPFRQLPILRTDGDTYESTLEILYTCYDRRLPRAVEDLEVAWRLLHHRRPLLAGGVRRGGGRVSAAVAHQRAAAARRQALGAVGKGWSMRRAARTRATGAANGRALEAGRLVCAS